MRPVHLRAHLRRKSTASRAQEDPYIKEQCADFLIWNYYLPFAYSGAWKVHEQCSV